MEPATCLTHLLKELHRLGALLRRGRRVLHHRRRLHDVLSQLSSSLLHRGGHAGSSAPAPRADRGAEAVLAVRAAVAAAACCCRAPGGWCLLCALRGGVFNALRDALSVSACKENTPAC